jgi:hypothetical protein
MGISGGAANIGKFARFALRILKPIGFLFSAYDGVMAFMNTEGSFLDKFVAGIGAFIGDFVGAPLDLLKSIVAWALEKLGFKEAATWLQSWSFETIINDLIGGIYGLVQGAVKWVEELFTDPGKALSDLFWAYIKLTSGVYKTIGEWIYNIAVKPLWTWFENTFPDLSAWISTAWNDALGYGGDLGAWIWNNSIGPLVDWIKNKFGGLAEYFGLDVDLGLPRQPAPPPQAPQGSALANPPPGEDGQKGYWKSLGRGKGDEWVSYEPPITTVPKTTGQNLQQAQSSLTSSQRSALSGGVVANNGNTTIHKGGDTTINLGQGDRPSAHDPRRDLQRLYVLGYGSRG